jgi:hypothetical protein
MYGQLKSEKVAEENQICRQMVRNISFFGVTERQRLLLIYLLAMEIEDPERMRAITSLVKELAGHELFLSSQVGEAASGTFDI